MAAGWKSSDKVEEGVGEPLLGSKEEEKKEEVEEGGRGRLPGRARGRPEPVGEAARKPARAGKQLESLLLTFYRH